jgi:glycosyltransferase involved in cell wall biosynthesis
MSGNAAITIGIDARELLGEPTGVGRYLGELLSRWATRADAARPEFLLYTPAPLPFVETLPRDAKVRQVVTGSGTGTWWEQTHLRRAARADKPDVFFAPAYTAPLGLGLPLVVTIHDVSFAAHPEWFTPREGARRRLLTRQVARSADLILTDSEFSRQEILTRLSPAGDRLLVIPPGVTRRAAGSATTGREPLALFVGSIFNRRKLPETIAAFAAATAERSDARLVIVGPDRSYPKIDLRKLADAAGVGTRVEVRDYAPDADLDTLYSQASVFVFLSEYEGFGLTPLEALSAGVPIVVLDTPIAREVYVLKRYSWDAAAAQTLDAIMRVGEHV